MEFEFAPVEALDKVPEQFRGIYIEGDGDNAGKFVVADAHKGVAEAISGFNKSNKALRDEVKAAKGSKVDLSPLAEYGDSPETIAEKVKEALAAASDGKSQDVSKAVEAAKQAMKDGFVKEAEKHTTRNTALQNQLYGLLVSAEATSAIAESKGVPELLMPFVKNQVKVVEEAGEFKVQVIDAAGEIRYGATGSQMTIKELIAEMKSNEKYGRLFESELPPGGGMRPGSGNQSPRAPGTTKSANEKIAAGLLKTHGRR